MKFNSFINIKHEGYRPLSVGVIWQRVIIMELAFKIVITLVVILVSAKILFWTWTSHIDPKATFHKLFFKEPTIAETVVTRDPNKLYQNGIPAADIIGSVHKKDGTMLFDQIANVSFDHNKTIEYGRLKLKITRIQSMIGMKSVVTNEGSRVLNNVLEGVLCDVL